MNSRLILSVVASVFLLGVVSCDRVTDQDSTKDSAGNTRSPSSTTSDTQPDNTARNKADLDTHAKTPMDQSNSSADIKITAEIRRAIMDDKSMSVNAQNCKVITDKAGMVTLRGPVDSQAEKDSIESKAKAVAGVSSVVNELEVKTK